MALGRFLTRLGLLPLVMLSVLAEETLLSEPVKAAPLAYVSNTADGTMSYR